MQDHLSDYNQGRAPAAVAQHEKVAEHYGNPSVNLAQEVTDRINAKEFRGKDRCRCGRTTAHKWENGKLFIPTSIADTSAISWLTVPARTMRFESTQTLAEYFVHARGACQRSARPSGNLFQ